MHAEMKELEEAIQQGDRLPYAADGKSGRSGEGIPAGESRCCMQV